MIEALDDLVVAYNERQLSRLKVVFQEPEIYDPVLLLLDQDIRARDLTHWAEAGWAVDDTFRIASACVLSPPGAAPPGAELVAQRRNRVLKDASISEIQVSYKLQIPGTRIIRLVGDRIEVAQENRAAFCQRFAHLFAARSLQNLVPC